MEETKTILIADSGATKADWCVTRNGNTALRFQTKGISPVYQDGKEIGDVIASGVVPQLKGVEPDVVCFYGAGCVPEKIPVVKNALFNAFREADINVYSDLLAAAHALCGHRAGIACILGTGSNSCEWDGTKIVKHIPPLGFILGDEGSGGTLGKLLVSDALKNRLTPGLKEKMLDQYALTPAAIIDKVYREPFPSRFLAGFSPFIKAHIDDASIRRIVEKTFSDFFERNIMPYDYRRNSIHFTGSIAWHYASILRDIAAAKGLETGLIVQSPMQRLVDYYG